MTTIREIEEMTDHRAADYVAREIMGYDGPSPAYINACHNLDLCAAAAKKLGCRFEIILWPGSRALVRTEFVSPWWSIEFEHENAARAAVNALIAASEFRRSLGLSFDPEANGGKEVPKHA
jgi:hypothetical protein